MTNPDGSDTQPGVLHGKATNLTAPQNLKLKLLLTTWMLCNRYQLLFVKSSFQGVENKSFQVFALFTALGYMHTVVFCSTEQRKNSLCLLLQSNPIKRLSSGEKSWRYQPCNRLHTASFSFAFPSWRERQHGAMTQCCFWKKSLQPLVSAITHQKLKHFSKPIFWILSYIGIQKKPHL